MLESTNVFMKKMTSSLVLLLAAAALAASGAAPEPAAPTSTAPEPAAATNTAPAKPALKASDLFPDTVVAKGKGLEVKRSRLDEEVIRLEAQYAAGGQPVPAEHKMLLEQQVLEQIIQVQLLQAKATDADKAAAKELAEKRLADAKAQIGSEETFNLRLKTQNLTREELLKRWTEAAVAEAVLKRELKVNITDDDAKKYYDENPARFEEPEKVHVSHILLSTRDPSTQAELSADKKAAKHKQAEDLLKRARAGEDFTKLAKEFSEDPGVKQNDGEYTFSRADPFVPEFKAAAFSLNTNQISDIVTTQFGYHIIKLLEKIPAKKIELAKIATKLKENLTAQAIQKQYPAYMDTLKKEAGVEILDEKLKPLERPAPPALPAGHPAVKPEAKS